MSGASVTKEALACLPCWRAPVTLAPLKGGLTNTLMLKDVNLYVELAARLGVASPNSAGPLASFGLARALGYADEISNTVVDALGDLSGGVRLHTKEDSAA